MKRLSPIELCVFVIGLTFLIYGLAVVISPHSGVSYHLTNDELGLRPWYARLEFSKTEARAFGLLAALLGFGMISASLWREKK